MNAQTDLFSEPADTGSGTALIKPGSPLAMPCGYLDRSNNRCRKLAHRPVMMNGKQMHSYGRPMLHCEMECFTGAQTEVDERSTPT